MLTRSAPVALAFVATTSLPAIAQTVQTMRGARTMGLDPRSHTVYTVSARFGPAPAPATPANPRRRPPVLPGSFTLLVLQQ